MCIVLDGKETKMAAMVRAGEVEEKFGRVTFNRAKNIELNVV